MFHVSVEMFYGSVERWRDLVSQVVNEVLTASSTYQALLQRLNLTRLDLVNYILGIIQKESAGDPGAIGDSGNSIGLMQLNFGAGTPQRFGYTSKDELKEPYANITAGTLYFLSQLKRYENIEKALSAYNAGSATASNQVDYVDKILSYLGLSSESSEKKNT